MRKKGTKVMGNNGIELERDGFKSRTGFILACIGSAVGMGNIWRFPYMVSAWGGMTFLIPYVIFVILIGSTGVIEEMALGRATKGGPIKAFGDCMQMRIGKRKAGEAIGFISCAWLTGFGNGLYCSCWLDIQIYLSCIFRKAFSNGQ